MASKLTTSEFIEKAIRIHGDKYDYSKSSYVNARTKVCIICPTHGEFLQTPSDHLCGKGCKKCGTEKSHAIMSSDSWIETAKRTAGEDYDYSNVDYRGNKEKVEIICRKHGSFLVRPNDFLSGHGCPKCGVEKRSEKLKADEDGFIRKIEAIFPQYDTSKVTYVNSHTKVSLICPIHGQFESLPYHLLKGHGCYACGQDSTHDKQRKTIEEFLEQAKEVHGDKYDYSKAEYINRSTKLCIICPKHGEFLQTPFAHINLHQGCPKCNSSMLEERISSLLTKEGILFEQEKRFEWLGKQRLDFYLPKYNVAIECQGIQHFIPVAYFGGKEGFDYRMANDEKKLKLCSEHGVKLLYFSNFKEKNIYTKENDLLKEIYNGFEENKLFIT